MRKMTEENMKAALAGESQAHIRYLAYATRAEREGKPNIARLFRATAYSEEVHATQHLRELGGIGNTTDNLAAALAGETFEVEEMYPAYQSVAELQSEQGAGRAIRYALAAEQQHASLYADAREVAGAGKDITDGEIAVCPVCGHTVTGDAPDRCPICGAAGKSFRKF